MPRITKEPVMRDAICSGRHVLHYGAKELTCRLHKGRHEYTVKYYGLQGDGVAGECRKGKPMNAKVVLDFCGGLLAGMDPFKVLAGPRQEKVEAAPEQHGLCAAGRNVQKFLDLASGKVRIAALAAFKAVAHGYSFDWSGDELPTPAQFRTLLRLRRNSPPQARKDGAPSPYLVSGNMDLKSDERLQPAVQLPIVPAAFAPMAIKQEAGVCIKQEPLRCQSDNSWGHVSHSFPYYDSAALSDRSRIRELKTEDMPIVKREPAVAVNVADTRLSPVGTPVVRKRDDLESPSVSGTQVLPEVHSSELEDFEDDENVLASPASQRRRTESYGMQIDTADHDLDDLSDVSLFVDYLDRTGHVVSRPLSPLF